MRLQRITTSSRWIPEIDGLRFLAILSVLLIHVLAQINSHAALYGTGTAGHEYFIATLYRLGRGVQLFFAISGYILAQPFLRHFRDGGKAVSLSGFYLRRLTRLEPPYLLSLVLYAVGMLVLHRMPLHTAMLSFLLSAGYAHNLIGKQIPPLNLVTWSLEVEVQFYLLVPLLASLFRLRGNGVRRGVIVACILLSALPAWTAANAAGFYLPAQLCYFFTGFLLADLRVEQRTTVNHPLWDISTLLVWPLFFFLPESRLLPAALCILLLAGFHATFLGPVSRRLLSLRPIALLGGMCYSMYLLHLMVISFVFRFSHRAMMSGNFYMDYAIQLLLLLPVILAVSILYFLAVERPCMDPHWPKALWKRLRPGASGQITETV